MDAEWIISPTARRILLHWADPRPAWLWSHDGTTLIWRNRAARTFNGKIKKHGLKLAPQPVPIKGQIARLIRLGSIGQSSLSRLQFLAGDKPVSTTCACTPLTMADGDTALLLVGADPIDAEVLDADAETADRMPETLFAAGADYLVVDGDRVRGGSTRALDQYAPHYVATKPADQLQINGTAVPFTRFRASPDGATLLLFGPSASPSSRIGTVRAEEGEAIEPVEQREADLADIAEPLLPMGLPPAAPAEAPTSDVGAEDEPFPERSLSSLFDRLAEDSGLYTTLTAGDEVFAAAPDAEAAPPAASPAEMPDDTASTEPVAAREPREDMIGAIIDYDADLDEAAIEANDTLLWRIVGRRFTPTPEEAVATETPPALPTSSEAVTTVDAAPDTETAERVSRYNFEELGRILTDRVAGETLPEVVDEPVAMAKAASADGVITLTAETPLLNRLPLGIMVFRDQQVLFANRALVELTGHGSVEALRKAGIASIFPSQGGSASGPVTHLADKNGTMLPVTARLQSVTWQGRAALMLSASLSEQRIGHEVAVRGFAEIAADAREEGFVAADRAGVITLLSGHGRVLLGKTETDLTGRPLTELIAPQDGAALRAFLERPARFAETARPSFVSATTAADVELILFAEGQAGVVSGYFGFLRRRVQTPVPVVDGDVEPSMLARLSRGIRRPLNTIIGFADMIGETTPERHGEYARDIKTAGTEIAVLVDELDDFARLRDGRYAPRPTDVDLASLLESCAMRVRAQAGAARVLVRSAISERLPRIRADRASLGQAVLNLLASAIDQTPVGGSVILSAQWQDDGGVAVHVRDGAQASADLNERFVVFRDGVGKDGEQLTPVRSTVGLALTRSLLAVNACSLSVDPTAGVGTLFSLVIPAELIVQS